MFELISGYNNLRENRSVAPLHLSMCNGRYGFVPSPKRHQIYKEEYGLRDNHLTKFARLPLLITNSRR
jgi:hypothetical protein